MKHASATVISTVGYGLLPSAEVRGTVMAFMTCEASCFEPPHMSPMLKNFRALWRKWVCGSDGHPLLSSLPSDSSPLLPSFTHYMDTTGNFLVFVGAETPSSLNLVRQPAREPGNRTRRAASRVAGSLASISLLRNILAAFPQAVLEDQSSKSLPP